MEFFPNIKTILSFGPITVTWYAFFILCGALLAYAISIRTLKKWGYASEIFEDFFIYMLPIGILGARLYYVLFEWERYASDPIRIFYIWEGGLAIHGGLIAATVFGLWYFRKHAVDGLRLMDAIFPNILIAQAIGRWGNFINQEAYGRVVSEGYYRFFPSFIKDQMYIVGEYREPTFLYESILNLFGWGLITFVYRKHGRRKRGDLAFAYLCWYGVVRFWIETMRTDALMLGSLKMAQMVSLLFVMIGILGILGVFDRLFRRVWPFCRQKPVVLFDLDGTLVDTKDLIYASFRHTFQKYLPEHQLSEEELASFLGPTLKQSFIKYFREEQIDEIIAYYRAFNHENHNLYVRGFAGAKETLAYLKENGYQVGVVSNKVEHTIKMGLEAFHLDPYIDVIVGAQDIEHPKPNPEGLLLACAKLYHNHDEVSYVGDSPSDIIACRNMAAFSVAAAFDPMREKALVAAKPCRTIHNLIEIIDLVKEDLEWSDNTIW